MDANLLAMCMKILCDAECVASVVALSGDYHKTPAVARRQGSHGMVKELCGGVSAGGLHERLKSVSASAF